jgi:hypothetical protein
MDQTLQLNEHIPESPIPHDVIAQVNRSYRLQPFSRQCGTAQPLSPRRPLSCSHIGQSARYTPPKVSQDHHRE